MTIIISGDTGVPVSPVTGTLAVLNGGTGVTTSTGSGANVLGTSPSISGAVMTTMASSVLTSGTAQASTSGTSMSFTGIPSWAKRITISFSGLSTSGTSNPIIQLGTGSTTYTVTGYLGGSNGGNTAMAGLTYTTGLGLSKNANFGASTVVNGMAQFTLIGSDTWAGFTVNAMSDSVSMSWGATSIVLGATLTAIRLTTANGTDTFDAGLINILYE